MTDRRRYALVGTGERGLDLFARAITTTYADVAELVGLHDRNRLRAEAGSRFSGGVPVFDTFDDMLAATRPDTVIVTSMDATHLLHGDLHEDGTLTTDVGVLDLGAARAACWPGEVLPALGLRSKARLDTPVPLLFGLANDELGYILPDEDFVEPTDWDDPGRQYEESMSVGPDAGSRLLSALDALNGRMDG